MKAPLEQCHALILSISPFKESSAVITAVTQEGVASFLAKGLFKPKSSLKPMSLAFNFLDIDYYRRGEDLRFVSSVRVIHDISSLYSDYSSNVFLTFLQEMSVLLYNFGDAYPLDEILTLLQALREGKDRLSLALMTLGVFYRSLGLKVNTEECLSCHRKQGIVSYSLPDGGFLCHDCCQQFGQEKKPDMELLVLRYAFMDLTDENLSRRVPKDAGIRVLKDLIANLTDYFDLKAVHSLPMLLETL